MDKIVDFLLFILKKNRIYFPEMDDNWDNQLAVLFGFYCHKFISDYNNHIIPDERHIDVIRDIVSSKNGTLIGLLKIDLFVDIYVEWGYRNNITDLFTSEIMAIYMEAIDYWNDLNQHKQD